MRIGELAGATGTKAETIRYYEQIGIMPAPARSASNYRSYGPEHVQRLTFVRRARELGFSLDQVRDLIRLADETDLPCGTVEAIARSHLQTVQKKLAELTALGAELERLIGECAREVSPERRIIEALCQALAGADDDGNVSG